jgi:hypothetical protein
MKNKILMLIAFATLGLTFATLAQVPNYVPTNGLVGYWPFNGNANDESGNGNNGTVNGATLTTDRNGNGNSAYYFNGGGNYITIPYSSSIAVQGGITISCWFLIVQLEAVVTHFALRYLSSLLRQSTYRAFVKIQFYYF